MGVNNKAKRDYISSEFNDTLIMSNQFFFNGMLQNLTIEKLVRGLNKQFQFVCFSRYCAFHIVTNNLIVHCLSTLIVICG